MKSPRFDNLVGAPLTDERIAEYCRQGKYGPQKQLDQLAYDTHMKESKTPKRARSPKHPLDLTDLL